MGATVVEVVVELLVEVLEVLVEAARGRDTRHAGSWSRENTVPRALDIWLIKHGKSASDTCVPLGQSKRMLSTGNVPPDSGRTKVSVALTKFSADRIPVAGQPSSLCSAWHGGDDDSSHGQKGA